MRGCGCVRIRQFERLCVREHVAARKFPDMPYNVIEMLRRPLTHDDRRPGYAQMALVVFLLIFTVGLIVLCVWYLLPAMETFFQAEQRGDKAGRKAISATAALLLSVLLLILLSGLVLTVRMGRFFFPRKSAPRTRTKYVDAWAESGKRMQSPPPSDTE